MVLSIIHARNFCCTDWTSNTASMFSIFYRVLVTDVFTGGNYVLSSHNMTKLSFQSASLSSVQPYGVSSPSSATFKPCTSQNLPPFPCTLMMMTLWTFRYASRPPCPLKHIQIVPPNLSRWRGSSALANAMMLFHLFDSISTQGLDCSKTST